MAKKESFIKKQPVGNFVKKQETITESERLAAESYARKIELEKKKRAEDCFNEIKPIIEKYKCQFVVQYAQQSPYQPSVGQVAIIAE